MNNELNKKLAKWVGFKTVPRFGGTDRTQTLWQYPNGDHSRGLPHFTESPDACFKWLVPKLIEEGIEWSIYGYKFSFARLLKPCMDSWEGEAVNGDKPALALCLAIEKLIDEEVRNEHRSSTNNS